MITQARFMNVTAAARAIVCLTWVLVGLNQRAAAQTDNQPLNGRDGRQLLLDQFRPQSMLRAPQKNVTRAKFPLVDIHTHFRYRLRHDAEQLDAFVAEMDRHHIAVCVSLDGGLGTDFDEHAKFLWTKYPKRFAIFANIDWVGDGKQDDPSTWACHQQGFARETVQKLRAAVTQGACGLKLFKRFGLQYRNPDGSLVRIDDARWDPIWQVCGELKIPVIIHTADPAAFFLAINEQNERWEELHRHPEWSFPADRFPARSDLLAARNRVIARHPGTTFIGAHVANNPEDLQQVARWLERYPNLVVEFASRIGELGRQPYTARRFMERYADRVLFGTDGPWPTRRIQLYFQFLETYDEYFPYSEKEFPPQGFWQIYGVGLSDETLRKIYYENALRIVPGLESRYRAAQAVMSER